MLARYESCGLSLAVALGLGLVAYLFTSFQRRRRTQMQDRHRPQQKKGHGASIEPLTGFDWKTTLPAQHWPFQPVYHITMGLRAASPSNLITIDADYLERIMLRRRLMAVEGARVHGSLAEGADAVRELYGYLMGTYLPTRYPTVFRLHQPGDSQSGVTVVENLASGARFPTTAPGDAGEALRILGETVEEDLFLLTETEGGHRAVAFVCCFPSGFEPGEKLGKVLGEIHAEVPSYERIGGSMERFFARLEVGRDVKRLNWTVQTHGDLFYPGGEDEGEVDLEKVHMRNEVQTLSRLPGTRAILFAFKTYCYPVRRVKEEGRGPEVAEAIRGLRRGNAPGMWEYKEGPRWGGRVCEYLMS